MLFSIIIPIWNDEKYLNECLDSCLNQQLSLSEYEIICVDDGSTDRTPEILRTYSEKYPNVRVITKPHGIKYGSGRMIGLSAADGEYVWFVDHDDLVGPGALDELKHTIEQNPGCGRILFPCYMFYDELNDAEKALFAANQLRSNDGGSLKDEVVWSAVYSHSFLLEHGIQPLSSRIQTAQDFWQLDSFPVWAADTIFVEECLDKGIQTFELEERPLYFYRRHDDSQSLDASPEVVQRRALLRRNFVLIWGYLIDQLERQCQAERQTLGRAKPETVEKLIDRLRKCSSYMGFLPFKEWRFVIRKFSEKGLFLKRKPAEYQLSFRAYRSGLRWKEKLLPHLVMYYFTYTKIGAILYRLLAWPLRAKRKNKYFAEHKLQKEKERLVTVGTESIQG